MPWKVRRTLTDSRGNVVARAGDILPDDDPHALAAKPNQVTRVQPVEPVTPVAEPVAPVVEPAPTAELTFAPPTGRFDEENDPGDDFGIDV